MPCAVIGSFRLGPSSRAEPKPLRVDYWREGWRELPPVAMKAGTSLPGCQRTRGYARGGTPARKGASSVLLYLRLQEIVASAFKRQEGQTMAEYAVIVAVVLLGAVAAFSFLRDNILDAVDGAASLI